MNALIKGVLGLLTLAIGIALAWWLSNRWDVAPQPVPAALALSTEPPPTDGVLQVLAKAPKLGKPLEIPRCSGADCSETWNKALPRWQALLREQTEFGRACEAATMREPLLAMEAYPAHWSINMEMPQYAAFANCVNWWQVRAMLATDAGDADAAFAALRQSDRLARALQQGSRWLIGQMFAHSMLGRQLNLLIVIGERRPAWRPRLLPLAEIEGRELMAGTRRWIPIEAAFGRGAIDSMRSSAEFASVEERLSWRLLENGAQPEYTKQLMSSHWLRLMEAAQGDDPEASLARVKVALEPEPGWFGTGFRWFHTLPHILHDVALPGYVNYFQRPADLQLAAQATQLWLRGGRPEQAQGLLRERLSQESDGGWRLRLHKVDPNPGMPTYLPALN